MVIRAKSFTPELMISAPRRGEAVPCDDGTLAFYTVSTYSFEDHKNTKEIRILDIKSGESTVFIESDRAHDAAWIPGTCQIMWLMSGEKGNTDLMIGEALDPDNAYCMDTIEAPFGDLKLSPLDDGIAVAFSGWADEKGSLYNKEIAEKSPSTGRIYDKLYVRFWNTYCDPQNRSVIWYSKLVKDGDKKWKLAAPVHNALKGTDFESPFPYDPLGGGGGNFDISSSGILFVANDPDSKPQARKANVYFVPLSSFVEEKAPTPKKLKAANYQGDAANPRFSPCGKRVFFLATDAKRQIDIRIMFIPDITKSHSALDLLKSASGDPWDLIPSGIEWSKDGKSLFITADWTGRICIFQVSLTSGRDLTPKQLTRDGAVNGYHELGNSGKLLVSSSSWIDPSIYSLVDLAATHEPLIISSSSKHGSKFNLSSSQVSEIYFEGDGDYCIHAWVVKPRNFDSSKKYPLALLIHGGPEDAWREAWSYRWNPALWAAQGYVCVLPNVTGSTGYGIDLTEGIYNSWGGRPYHDLEKCYDYVKENMKFVDVENAIAAGASYGGYMANWVQGNPLGRKFKTIVCHDGVFSIPGFIAGDSFEGTEDFAGPMLSWVNSKNLERYNPARPDKLAQWATPMLIIHSDKDYRCIVSDGLAAFGVCQAKGIESKYLTFPDEGHWVLNHENSLLWHNTVFDWINKYSGISAKRDEEAAFESLSSMNLISFEDSYHEENMPQPAPQNADLTLLAPKLTLEERFPPVSTEEQSLLMPGAFDANAQEVGQNGEHWSSPPSPGTLKVINEAVAQADFLSNKSTSDIYTLLEEIARTHPTVFSKFFSKHLNTDIPTEQSRNPETTPSNQRILDCHYCDQVFNNLEDFRSHLSFHRDRGDSLWQTNRNDSPVVEEIWGYDRELIKQDERQSSFRCAFCDDEFLFLWSVEDHVRRHIERGDRRPETGPDYAWERHGVV